MEKTGRMAGLRRNIGGGGQWQKLLHRLGRVAIASRRAMGGQRQRLLHRPLLILIILILMTSGAGAAVGTLLMGEITADVHVTVSQALVVAKPVVTHPSGGSWGKPWFSSVKDDRTSFSVAVEVAQGDIFTILVPLVNRGEQDIVVEMTVTPTTTPSQEAIIKFKAEGSGVIDDVVQVSYYKWKFTLDGAAAGGSDGVKIQATIDPTAPPGFYEFSGTLTPVPY